MSGDALSKLNKDDLIGSITAILNEPFTQKLATPLGLDNMPLGSYVSIDEKDNGDGFYEGLHYDAILQGTRLMYIPVAERLEDAVGSLLWSLGKSTVLGMLDNLTEITLPVSIGATFTASDIRNGTYIVTETQYLVFFVDKERGNIYNKKIEKKENGAAISLHAFIPKA